MSAFSGLFFRHSRNAQRKGMIDRLSSSVAAHGYGRPTSVLSSPDAYIVKFDPGAYGSAASLGPDGVCLAVLAGHPYVDGVPVGDRREHLRVLADYVRDDEVTRLSEARGTYCAAFVIEATHSLILATDCLGIRPLYYYADDAVVLFSTTLWTIAGFLGSTEVDQRGAIELAALGFSLGDRTQYASVKCVPGGRAVRFSECVSEPLAYWNWRGPSSRVYDAASVQRSVFEAFNDAVRLRLGSDRHAMAFLTGGLDSRCVVSAVCQAGASVSTVNFAPPHSQDLVFGQRLSRAIGTQHLELPMPRTSVAGKIATVMPQWLKAVANAGVTPEHPLLVWSGDGGSVGLGHLHLNDKMVDLAENNRTDDALRLLLKVNTWQVPVGVLQPALAVRARDYLFEGLREELTQIESADKGRALHILLMVTDQRRHIADHFERIYEHCCEMQMPFFDRDFLKSVLSQPVRPFLAHRFYSQWLKLFPEAVQKIPWQAYPDHEPCPHPVEENLVYQWDERAHRHTAAAARRTSLRRILSVLLNRRYRNTGISGPRLALLWLATTLGIRDYSYALAFAETVCAARR